MRIATPAIVLAVRPHGEHGAVARLLTPADGLQPGYVRGGRSRRLRPVLQPGNLVEAEFRARSETQLAGLTVELTRSRAGLAAEALPAAAIEWLTALTASALPEGQPYPRLYDALAAVLDAVEAAPSARGWVGGVIRYELLALVELGYGGPDVAPSVETDWSALLRAIDDNGTALRDHLFADRRAWALDARERLVTRLRRLA